MIVKIFTCLTILCVSVSPANQLRAQSVEDSVLEPEAFSIFPLGATRGESLSGEIRGEGLEGAYALWFENLGLAGEIKEAEEIELPKKIVNPAGGSFIITHKPGQRIVVELEISQSAKLGANRFRVVTPQGVSNALKFWVDDDRVIGEMHAEHSGPNSAQLVSLPAVINGRIAKPGELDYYKFEASAGSELSFGVLCDNCRNSVRAGFEPQILLYNSHQSWLDPNQVTWIASSRALQTDTSLVHQFKDTGQYLVAVASLLGKGTPDYAYQLQISEQPVEHQKTERPFWWERTFTRNIEPNRPEVLWSRTVRQNKQNNSATEKDLSQPSSGSVNNEGGANQLSASAVSAITNAITDSEPNESLAQAITVTVPTLIEGTIDRPSDIDTFKFKTETLQGLAFEIQTTDVTLPRFNPRLTILDAEGRELLTNIHKKIWILLESSPSMTPPAFLEALEPKIIDTFEPGEYYLQISEVTSDRGNPNYAYRVMIRPQISHVGEIHVQEDHLNLSPGEAKKLTFMADLEEGFAGELSFAVKNLPKGVRALPGTDAEIRRYYDGPKLGYDSFKRESFVPITQKVTIMLIAEENAPVTAAPKWLWLTAQPIVDGKLGPLLKVGKIPVMVVKARERGTKDNG